MSSRYSPVLMPSTCLESTCIWLIEDAMIFPCGIPNTHLIFSSLFFSKLELISDKVIAKEQHTLLLQSTVSGKRRKFNWKSKSQWAGIQCVRKWRNNFQYYYNRWKATWKKSVFVLIQWTFTGYFLCDRHCLYSNE